jgi:hypothetical protein
VRELRLLTVLAEMLHPPAQWNDIVHDSITDVPDGMRDFAGQLLLWLTGRHKIPFDHIASHQPV